MQAQEADALGAEGDGDLAAGMRLRLAGRRKGVQRGTPASGRMRGADARAPAAL